MSLYVYASHDNAFDRIAAKIWGGSLVIRTPNQYVSMFWFGVIVAIAAFYGLYSIEYFNEMPYLWAIPLLFSSVVLFFIWLQSTHNQRMIIDHEHVRIETQALFKWVVVHTLPLKDITAFRIGITGNEEQSTHVRADSVAGFIAAKTLGIGWITTVTETREVAIFFLHIITRQKDNIISLMNYSRKSSDKVMGQIQTFVQHGRSK